MRSWIASALLLPLMIGCASTPKRQRGVSRDCGPTPVTAQDLAPFGFNIPANKVIVVRVFATWCPYCKDDLTELGKNFRQGRFRPENVEVLLMSYRSRRETKDTHDAFMRGSFKKYGIPDKAVQILHVDQDYNALSQSQTKTGEALFTGWQGVPFGLVFAKDGRLAFRGHFTTSPQFQDGHYDMISDLVHEVCPAP